MVEDPVAHVGLPNLAEGLTIEWQGQVDHVVGEETRREFEKQQEIGSK